MNLEEKANQVQESAQAPPVQTLENQTFEQADFSPLNQNPKPSEFFENTAHFEIKDSKMEIENDNVAVEKKNDDSTFQDEEDKPGKLVETQNVVGIDQNQNEPASTNSQDDVIKSADENSLQDNAIQPPPSDFNKIVARQNQPVGPSGATLPYSICKNFIEIVKFGDFAKFQSECQKYQIELRDIKSEPVHFSQNLIFPATMISKEDEALKFVVELIESGVDIFQKDSLKQTPMFYAARDGKTKLIQFFQQQGLQVNDIDTHGQTPIFYAVSTGQVESCKVLRSLGADHDQIDLFSQTPLYYAIKSYKLEVFNWILEMGANLQMVDKKGQGLIRFAAKHNRHNMKDVLAEQGALNQTTGDERRSNQKSRCSDQPKMKLTKQNERLQKKKYVLQVFDGVQYRPINQEEFEQLAKDEPEIQKLFEDEDQIKNLEIPQIDENVPIYYHWEKVSHRMMNSLSKHSKAWIFNSPVDPVALGIKDYFDIIKKPMDFSQIKENLKSHHYMSMREFVQDVELVFKNCYTYNGESSQVSLMCKEVQDEFLRLCEILQVQFYITDISPDTVQNQ